jgi:uncharacterized membrane protein
VFVPKRYSGGWTVNVGHPLGKLIMIATLLLGVVLAILKALSGVSISNAAFCTLRFLK